MTICTAEPQGETNSLLYCCQQDMTPMDGIPHAQCLTSSSSLAWQGDSCLGPCGFVLVRHRCPNGPWQNRRPLHHSSFSLPIHSYNKRVAVPVPSSEEHVTSQYCNAASTAVNQALGRDASWKYCLELSHIPVSFTMVVFIFHGAP